MMNSMCCKTFCIVIGFIVTASAAVAISSVATFNSEISDVGESACHQLFALLTAKIFTSACIIEVLCDAVQLGYCFQLYFSLGKHLRADAVNNHGSDDENTNNTLEDMSDVKKVNTDMCFVSLVLYIKE